MAEITALKKKTVKQSNAMQKMSAGRSLYANQILKQEGYLPQADRTSAFVYIKRY